MQKSEHKKKSFFHQIWFVIIRLYLDEILALCMEEKIIENGNNETNIQKQTSNETIAIPCPSLIISGVINLILVRSCIGKIIKQSKTHNRSNNRIMFIIMFNV